VARDGKSLLKMGCLGCAGVVGVIVLVFAVLGAVALTQVSGEEIAQATLSHELPQSAAVGGEPLADSPVDVAAPGDPAEVAAVARVLLDIKNADVYLKRGLAGQAPTVEATYDERYYTLEQKPSPNDEGVPTWHVWFRRTGGHGGAMALMRRMMGASNPEINVYLPPDIPLALHGNFESGATTGDIGGMQITELVIELASGALILDISEPSLPMERFEVDVRQAGMTLGSIGNASPRIVEIDLIMAGGVFDMSGAWRQGAELSFEAKHSGGLLVLPRNVDTDGLEQIEGFERLSRPAAEIPGPLLRFDVETSGFGKLELAYDN